MNKSGTFLEERSTASISQKFLFLFFLKVGPNRSFIFSNEQNIHFILINSCLHWGLKPGPLAPQADDLTPQKLRVRRFQINDDSKNTITYKMTVRTVELQRFCHSVQHSLFLDCTSSPVTTIIPFYLKNVIKYE